MHFQFETYIYLLWSVYKLIILKQRIVIRQFYLNQRKLRDFTKVSFQNQRAELNHNQEEYLFQFMSLPWASDC